jgi:hypothetical protein
MIKKIEVERFTLSSSQPFDQVVAALTSAVGHPDMSEFLEIDSAERDLATAA